MENILINAEALHLGTNDVWVTTGTAVQFFPHITESGKVRHSLQELRHAVEIGAVRMNETDTRKTYNLWDCIRECNIR